MKKNIFITGCAGFIGFHLAKSLQMRGDNVIGYDNFNDYYTPALKKAREVELKKAGIPIIRGDVNDRLFLLEKVKEHQTTHIVHLAAQAGVRYSVTNPEAYLQSNLSGFLQVLETCRTLSLPLIYASSSSVYGLNEKTPFSPLHQTDRPTSLYGATKKANELMAHAYHHLYGFPVTALRFFTVYGPWGRPDMAYFSFTESILSGKPIEIFNQGEMQRDFTYIDDIIQGTLAAIDYSGTCEVFNLGNNQPVTLLSFIEQLEKALNKKAVKKFTAMQKGDVKITYADIDAAKIKLGYHPHTSIEEGIPKFIEWYNGYHFQNNR
jgi:UDP-glucuronate 4-epimerase